MLLDWQTGWFLAMAGLFGPGASMSATMRDEADENHARIAVMSPSAPVQSPRPYSGRNGTLGWSASLVAHQNTRLPDDFALRR